MVMNMSVRRGSVVVIEAINKKKDWSQETNLEAIGGRLFQARSALINFNNGYVTGAFLSDLVSLNNTKNIVAGFTSEYASSAIYLAESEFKEVGYQVGLVASYFLGAGSATLTLTEIESKQVIVFNAPIPFLSY